jgi:hypothetical protein
MTTPTNTNASSTAIATRSNDTGSAAARLEALRSQRQGGEPAPASTPAPVQTGGQEDAMAELARLRAENEALKAKAASNPRGAATLSYKATEKGGISIYGLGRFPVTQYPFGMLRLVSDGHVQAMRSFIATNLGSLSFTSAAQRDEVVAELRKLGFEISDAAVASAKVNIKGE